MLMILIVFSLIILSNELFHYQIRECFISKIPPSFIAVTFNVMRKICNNLFHFLELFH